MQHLYCVCGQIIRDDTDSVRNKAHILPGEDWDTALDNVKVHVSEFLVVGRIMYECEWCGRIWMRARPGKHEWVSYAPEGPRPRIGILSHEGVAPQEG
jgi:hypothetical protein